MNNKLEWDYEKYCNNVVFRRKFSKELLSLNHVVFLKKIYGNWQYMTMKSSENVVKSDMDYTHLVAFITFIIYLILTLCLYFGLLAWLLRTMPLSRKLRDSLLEPCCLFRKNWEQDFWVWSACCFFHDISSKLQYVSVRSRKMLYVASWWEIRKWTTWFKSCLHL